MTNVSLNAKRCLRRGLAAAILVLIVGPVPCEAALQYPNLVADPPGVLDENGTSFPPQVYADGYTSRLLLRFDGYVHNLGPGPLELAGSSPFGELAGPMMGRVTQRIYNSSGGYSDRPSSATLRYETSDDHRHWHLKGAARYSLWNAAKTGEVGFSSKIGFCLADIEPIDAGAAPETYDYEGNLDACRQEHPGDPKSGPGASSVRMGVSAGWRDVYDSGIALQWVDVSNTPPGDYWLRAEINPEGTILESPGATLNTPSFAPKESTVPGYLAAPVDRGHVQANGASIVKLASESFGKDGRDTTRRFKITTPPAHGKLTPSGRTFPNGWFDGDRVTYLPDPDYFGPDSFKFAAQDGASFFPRTQVSAAATMEVGSGGPTSLAISGAPASLVVGTAAQLSGRVTSGPSPRINWRVDGVDGGSASSGTISTTGLFTAPPTVPAGGVVHVEAVAADNVADEVEIRITAPPPSTPAPDISSARSAPLRTAALPSDRPVPRLMRVARHHRILVVKMVPPESGVLAVDVRQFGKRLKRVRFYAQARQVISRKITLPRRLNGGRVSIRATLRKEHRLIRRWNATAR